MAYVFISYSSGNRDYALRLAADLRRRGFDIWLDNDQLRASDDWWQVIVHAIWGCAAFLVVMTPESDRSRWVQREINIADGAHKPLFPVLLAGDANTPNWLIFGRTHIEDVRRTPSNLPTERFFDQLAQHAEQHPATGEDVTALRLDAALVSAEDAALPYDEAQGYGTGGTASLEAAQIQTLLRERWHSQDISRAVEPLQSGTIAPPPRPGVNRAGVIATLFIACVLIAVLYGISRGGSAIPPEASPRADTRRATEVPTPISRLGLAPNRAVTANDQWEIIRRRFDDVEMVLVPVGCFEMGAQGAGGRQCFEKPFWIDRYEMTNLQVQHLLNQPIEIDALSGPDHPYEFNGQGSFSAATAICEARGLRLPTEREWEYAARGPDNLSYPWGETFDHSNVSFCDANCIYGWADPDFDDGYAHSAPVGNYPGGVSWVGAVDMLGNVSNWIATDFAPYPYDSADGREDDPETGMLRGGSWESDWRTLSTTARYPLTGISLFSTGVRCVRDYNDDDL